MTGPGVPLESTPDPPRRTPAPSAPAPTGPRRGRRPVAKGLGPPGASRPPLPPPHPLAPHGLRPRCSDKGGPAADEVDFAQKGHPVGSGRAGRGGPEGLGRASARSGAGPASARGPGPSGTSSTAPPARAQGPRSGPTVGGPRKAGAGGEARPPRGPCGTVRYDLFEEPTKTLSARSG